MSDFTVKRGDTLRWTGAALKADGTAQDLTGCTLWLTAKLSLSDADADAVFQISSATSAITIAAGTGGTFTVTVPKTATASLTRKTLLYYDVQIKDATGQIFTSDSGTILVELDATVTTT